MAADPFLFSPMAASPILAGSSAPHPLMSAAQPDDIWVLWVIIGVGWVLSISILTALAYVAGRHAGRPDKQAVKKAIDKAFTKREEEADIHGRLAKLKGPMKAAYRAVGDALKDLGLWP